MVQSRTTNRPVTLFTGQWADLPFEQVCRYASEWGYDGLEIACWGDHLDVYRAADDDAYVAEKKATLAKYGLGVWAISNHLKGQAVCDNPIDFRHRDMVSDQVWGDGDAEGVRQRAATTVAPSRVGPWGRSSGSLARSSTTWLPARGGSRLRAASAHRCARRPWATTRSTTCTWARTS